MWRQKRTQFKCLCVHLFVKLLVDKMLNVKLKRARKNVLIVLTRCVPNRHKEYRFKCKILYSLLKSLFTRNYEESRRILSLEL